MPLTNLTPSNTSSHKHNSGFTLVEVLVAGLILFLTLAAGLRAYDVAMNGSHRAAQQLKMLQVTELVQAHINKAIKDEVQDAELAGRSINELSGQTNLMGVIIDWQAVLTEQGAPPPSFDEGSADDVDYAPRFFKFQVRLQLNLDGRAQTFTYSELAWFNRLQTEGA